MPLPLQTQVGNYVPPKLRKWHAVSLNLGFYVGSLGISGLGQLPNLPGWVIRRSAEIRWRS